MVQRYRRRARHASELDLGPLVPLDQAIPELRAKGGPDPRGGGITGVETGEDEPRDDLQPSKRVKSC
jgi:hypothetical protein